jgi:transcriptional regulator with XRE-family HTH domain
MTLGTKIKEMRRRRGVSQSDLAADLGITVTHVSHVENDRADPSLKLLRRIANKLGFALGMSFDGAIVNLGGKRA